MIERKYDFENDRNIKITSLLWVQGPECVGHVVWFDPSRDVGLNIHSRDAGTYDIAWTISNVPQ